jgi:hypothetical protein
MKNGNLGNDAVAYLAERAAIFFGYLDANELYQIFPYRKEAWADLEARVQSGSKAKLKALNDVIDNALIGKNDLALEDRYNILLQFEERLQEDRNTLLNKKLEIASKIIADGFIKSRTQWTDAIEIYNSEILGLTDEQRARLSEIIHLPLVGK